MNIRRLKRSKRCLLNVFLFLFLLMNFHLICKFLFNNFVWLSIKLKKNEQIFENLEVFGQYSDTLCSTRATKHGLHQRVIAVSAYQSHKDSIRLMDKIWSYTLEYISEAKHFYPDWRVRVYYDHLNVTIDQIIEIEKQFSNVDFCDVSTIPLLGDVRRYMHGRFYRFIGIVDRFVDLYMSRDIDSPILEREVISVNQWILSKKLFHIMRDHPLHHAEMLAGLWALKIYQNETIRKNFTQNLFSKSLITSYDSMNGDQDFLFDHIWPIAKEDSIEHDSFYCRDFSLSIPFPKPKLFSSQFVGCRRPCPAEEDPPGPCPIQCMSPNSTDPNLC